MNYKRVFLIPLIVALTLSALVGIIVFIAGDFGDTEIRILLTTLAIAGYSLSGLCSTTILKKEPIRMLAYTGMVVAVMGFILAILGIWEIVGIDDIWKLIMIFVISSFALAHISLLLTLWPQKLAIQYLLGLTIFFVMVVAIMLIDATLQEFNNDEIFFRLLGVVAILDVLGTIVTPILNRMQIKKSNHPES